MQMKNDESSTLERVNLRLWKHDLAYLKRKYPDNYNGQVRRIVGNWVAKHRGRGDAEKARA